MDVQVNYLAVLLAGLSTMVVGGVWYTPKVFGNMWMRLAKINIKQLGKRNPAPGYALALLFSLLTAYVLAHVTWLSHAYFQNSFLQDALGTAFWLWLGFTAVRIGVHDIFEGRPAKLTVLNVMHEFVTIMVMGLIIGLMQP